MPLCCEKIHFDFSLLSPKQSLLVLVPLQGNCAETVRYGRNKTEVWTRFLFIKLHLAETSLPLKKLEIKIYYQRNVFFTNNKQKMYWQNHQNTSAISVVFFLLYNSTSTIPVTLSCLQKGKFVDEHLGQFLLPIATITNLPGTAIYIAVSSVFISQTYHPDMLNFTTSILIW